MPVFRGTSPGLPPLPSGGGSGVVRPVIPDIGIYLPIWEGPDGEQLNLNPGRSNFMTLRSVSGLGAVPVDPITTPSADGGVIVEYVRPKERTVLWPLRWRADTHLDYLDVTYDLVERFTQCRRYNLPGKLILRRPNGQERMIPAWYASGLEQDAEEGMWTEQTAVINLLCPSPFWLDSAPVIKEWRQETGVDYLNPYPSFGTGQVLGAASLINDGVEDAWPTWTVRGPLTSLVALNQTRGETFTLTYTLLAGETMTMTTRPIRVRGKTGEQAQNALNLLAGGIPWRLDPKVTTDIVFTANGSASETAPGADDGTLIRLDYSTKRETS